ncbi:LysR family transcriptional regulator [Pseudanabaena sp. FACHB-2040]|uniref:LysR family transcriptional regulator n=1 Tax=Pseudanabaena sp. FACHB-2040 TaxID=2692859 RepID=UPI001682FD5D|nr:LysR family transcriptional regulator [Pseudanabaena sp. FACHB-2040]MBD2261256.1 LysR family transcriptional regulator [Pseudanabaena sp. FACHB-2040]
MELRNLRYFVTVAEELHFGRAAERLQLTQPALSKQIASLEKELGAQLFTRTKRTVALTAAGQVFWEQAVQILAQLEEAIHLIQRTARGEAGHLRIGFTETATHTVLPALVRRFRDRFPNVKLTMLELCTEAQVAALTVRQIDVAFLHPPIDERGLKLYSLLEEDFVAVLPKQHPLLSYEQIPVSAFADEPLIIHPRKEGPALYDGLIQICQQAGFQPKIVQESISARTRICLVAAGIGISFVPQSVQPSVVPDVACRALADCPMKLKFAAAWQQSSTAPTLQAFLDILLNDVYR